MLIAHLTDLHILEKGQKLANILDTNALALQAIETINAQPTRPSFVVVTGDLTHNGKYEEMEVAKKILDELDMPYFALPGGHDNATEFAEVFGERGWIDPDTGETRYVVDEFPVRLIVADTTAGKGEMPQFGHERCAWLDQTLSNRPETPTLLALHHPPIQCRIPVAAYVSDVAVRWAQELKAVVERHPQICSVVCGHVHRTTHAQWAGTLVSIGPGASVQTAPDFTDFAEIKSQGGRRTKLLVEPGGWQALWWDGEALLNFGLFADRSYASY